jgi:hypothetical protein
MGREHRGFQFVGAGLSAENLFDLRATTPLPLPRPAPAGGREIPGSTRPGIVCIRPLKELAKSLDRDHPIRMALLGEPDELPSADYLAKLSVWLRLIPLE